MPTTFDKVLLLSCPPLFRASQEIILLKDRTDLSRRERRPGIPPNLIKFATHDRCASSSSTVEMSMRGAMVASEGFAKMGLYQICLMNDV